MAKFFTSEAIVLKRSNFSEADRFITFFTKDYGKLTGLAKGARKLNSKKRPTLEPANHLRISLVSTKSTLLLTETILLNSFTSLKSDLHHLTQTYQILEIINLLTGEEQAHPTVFDHTVNLLSSLDNQGLDKTRTLTAIRSVLSDLGFGYPDSGSESLLKQHIEAISQYPLRSKPFFSLLASSANPKD